MNSTLKYMGLAGLMLASLSAGIGCGGVSAALGTNAGLDISATPNPAPYNTPVTLTWDSDRALEVITSNFGLDPSETEGSLTDNPGVDTTYRLTIRAQNEGHDPIEITESVTVEVAKSSKSVLVVGDSSVAGANQVLDSLKSLTNGTASISAAVPASTSADVIVLHPSASLTTSDRTRVEGLLSAGKAVVFVGSAVTAVSGGNVASIGGMLGGATSIGNGFDVEFREASGLIPISFRFRGLRLSAPVFTSYSGLQGVGGSADRLITDGGSITSAMAYKVPSGGRTGYVAEDGVGSSSRNQGFDLALRVITRWCMDGA